jgi:hypothetical protein
MKITSQTKMKISSQKYEQLIHEYQSKISSILKINNDLSNEADDLINSIYLNRDIISEYLKDFPEFKPLEKNLFSSIEKYLNNLEEKKNLEMQLNKLEHFQQSLPEEVELLHLNNEILKHDLVKILKKIYKMQKELEKQQKNSIYKISREEVFIVSPTKKNIELVDMINKLSKELENNYNQEIDKRRIKILDAKIKIIEEQVDKLKQNINKNSDENDTNNNDEEDGNEDEELDDEGDEKVEEDEIDDFYNMNELNKNGFNVGNKNPENENLELIEQIKYFKAQVEKLENENNETKNKIKEYDTEYKKLKEELKQLEGNDKNNIDDENKFKFTKNKNENLINKNINNNK